MSRTQPPDPPAPDLLAASNVARRLIDEAASLPSWDLEQQQVWDLELLLNGSFAPLTGYLGQADYASVCRDMRLADGSLWPIPVTLDVTEDFAMSVTVGDRVALRHPQGMPLAILTVTDAWTPDRLGEAERVYGTTSRAHPGVRALLDRTHPVYLGGRLEGIALPPHYTYQHLRHTPVQLRARFRELGWERIVAFQTRNPLHRAHVELTRAAAADVGGGLLLHPVVGRTSPGDVDYFSRVRCYQAVLERYAPGSVILSLLPLAMRMAGPREAVWHAIIRRNYGCTHFIIGRDHAGPQDDGGRPFYPPTAAQELAKRYGPEIGIEIISFDEVVYVEDLDAYIPADRVPPEARVHRLSGSEFRHRLAWGLDIPAWLSFPEVLEELRRYYPPRSAQGVTIFLTGLSGAGKSTVAHALAAKLMEADRRPVTLLDGDVVRKVLSTELGFSKADRDLNIRRIGFVAAEVTKSRGMAVCAAIAPYRDARREVREMVSEHGGFVEVYVSTPLEVCEVRDRKGLYARARAGVIKNFTGIDDVYEPPETPDVTIDASRVSVEEAVQLILDHLVRQGYLDRRGVTAGHAGLRPDRRS